MGRGHLNLWVTDKDCTPLQGCWKLDLKIRTCGNKPITEIDPQIMNYVHAPDSPTATKNQYGDIITFRNSNTSDPSINHLDINLSPGCYKINARVCHQNNEETHEIQIVIRCEDHLCAKMSVPETMDCGKGFIFPGLIHGIRQNFLREDVKGYVKHVAKLIEKPVQELKIDNELRIAELQGMGLTDLETYHNEANLILDEIILEQQ